MSQISVFRQNNHFHHHYHGSRLAEYFQKTTRNLTHLYTDKKTTSCTLKNPFSVLVRLYELSDDLKKNNKAPLPLMFKYSRKAKTEQILELLLFFDVLKILIKNLLETRKQTSFICRSHR